MFKNAASADGNVSALADGGKDDVMEPDE